MFVISGQWEEYSDCSSVWIFFFSSGGSILLLLIFIIISLSCCCKKVKSISSSPRDTYSIEMTAKYSMENVIHSDESSSSIQSAVGTPQEQSEPIMTELSLKTSSDMNAPAETSNPEATAFSEVSTPEEIGNQTEVPSTSIRTPPVIPPKPNLGALMGLSESHYELPPPPPPKPPKLSLYRESSSSEGPDQVKPEAPFEERGLPLNETESLSQSTRLPLPPPVSWRRTQSKQDKDEDEEPMVPHRDAPPLQPAKPLRRAPSLPSSDIPHRPNRPAPSLITEDDLYQAPPSRLVTPPSALQQVPSQSLHGSHRVPPPKPEKPSKPAHLFQSTSNTEVRLIRICHD